MDDATKKNISEWLEGPYDLETKEAVRKLQEENPKELEDAFYRTLTFGTGGLRGIMGVGSNRLNLYTIRAATQGFANTLKRHSEGQKQQSVLIGYDSRDNSRAFAEESAKVLAGNGIKAFLFEEISPTPLVSFGCRHLKCSGAIMITASHNPKEYNGYKVYWNDGAQVVHPIDGEIIEEVEKITTPQMVRSVESINNPLIEIVKDDVKVAYLNAIVPLQNYPKENASKGSELKIVYTSLHGAGMVLFPDALKLWGFTNVGFVDKQVIPDGSFPTVKYPNPENPAALELGIAKVMENSADILIATDPDADRVGIAVMHEGEVHLLNGNQVACLCLEHLCHALEEQGRMPERGAFVKTVVTTELFQAIADAYHKPCFNVLTGFKYIAELIRDWENSENGYSFIFGAEESYGYLLGTLARDKDAIIASALICEMALRAKLQGKTLIDLLNDLYEEYGVYVEKLLTVKCPETKEGHEQISRSLKSIQTNPPKEIAGLKVVVFEDDAKASMLVFWLSDKTKIIIRPSGTEPLVKVYCAVTKKVTSSVSDTILVCEQHADNILESLQSTALPIATKSI